MVEFICEGELIEILKRLPAKTLCRFLCVSKQWKTLISSTFFITLHKSSTTPNPTLKPYIQVVEDVNIKDNIHYVMCNHQPNLQPEELHFPFRTSTRSLNDFGCAFAFADVIHGVVCVSYSFESGFDSNILWNPAIRKYVHLPRLPFPGDLEAVRKHYPRCNRFYYGGVGMNEYLVRAKFNFSIVGFGYDTSNHVFKVVRIWLPNDPRYLSSPNLVPMYEVVVCSSLGFQTRVAIAPDALKSQQAFVGSLTGCFANGNIHWITRSSGLVFDCTSESFKIVDLSPVLSYDETVIGYIYDESMLLMDHPEVQSYSDEHQEEIVCKEDKIMKKASYCCVGWSIMVNNFGCSSYVLAPHQSTGHIELQLY